MHRSNEWHFDETMATLSWQLINWLSFSFQFRFTIQTQIFRPQKNFSLPFSANHIFAIWKRNSWRNTMTLNSMAASSTMATTYHFSIIIYEQNLFVDQFWRWCLAGKEKCVTNCACGYRNFWTNHCYEDFSENVWCSRNSKLHCSKTMQPQLPAAKIVYLNLSHRPSRSQLCINFIVTTIALCRIRFHQNACAHAASFFEVFELCNQSCERLPTCKAGYGNILFRNELLSSEFNCDFFVAFLLVFS